MELSAEELGEKEISRYRRNKYLYINETDKQKVTIDIISSKDGKILNISKVCPGRVHDFKIRKFSDKIPRDAEALVDSVYHELHTQHKNTILPQK